MTLCYNKLIYNLYMKTELLIYWSNKQNTIMEIFKGKKNMHKTAVVFRPRTNEDYLKVTDIRRLIAEMYNIFLSAKTIF